MLTSITLNAPVEKAFEAFVYDFNQWWPQGYTWSQDKLVEIRMGTEVNALCTEIGPHNFRCDWGRIVKFVANKELQFTWQIGPNRDPIPDSEKSSVVTLSFKNQDRKTQLTLQHSNFENHGDGGKEYEKMMASPQGWKYILEEYKEFCEQ